MVRLIRPTGKRVKKSESSKKEEWMCGVSIWVASRKGVGGGEEAGASGVGNEDASSRKQ